MPAPYTQAPVSTRVQWAVVLAALLLVWHSLADHPLLPPDEGRYGSVSAFMAEHGNWLTPQLRDHVHVTKPPLTYWAQAAGTLLFGRTELAVRLPSALGATLVVLTLFWFARRMWGPLVAVLAVGAYAVMPLPAIVGRLGTTDSLLNAWWWLALCTGCVVLQEGGSAQERTGAMERTGATHRTGAIPRRALVVVFWAAIALVGLTKGPLLVAPLAILGAWMLLAGRVRDLWRLSPLVGLPLAMAPLAVAAYLFWQANPERTAAVWKAEFVDRVARTGQHDDPMWGLLPVFIGGLVPASLTLVVDAFKTPWRRTWGMLRSGRPAALLMLATVLPLVGFSLLAGQQDTYLLPVAAPCALLYALVLRMWLDGRSEARTFGSKPGEVRAACLVAAVGLGAGPLVAAIAIVAMGRAPAWAPGLTLVWWSLVFVPAAVGWWMCGRAWMAPAARRFGLSCAFCGMAAMWIGVQDVEDAALGSMNSRKLGALLAESTRPVLVVGLKDLTIDFYSGEWTEFGDEPADIAPWLAAHPDGLVIVPERAGRLGSSLTRDDLNGLREIARFDVWPFKQAVLLEPARPAAALGK